MAIIGQDTFQRADQSGWGTSSDGQTWIQLAGTETLAIASGTATATGNIGVDNWMALGTNQQTDTDITTSFSFTNQANDVPGIMLRWQGNNTAYRLRNNGGNLGLRRLNAGVSTTIGADVAFALTNGTKYSMRCQIIGATIRGKMWKAADAEPDKWNYLATDTAPISQPGRFGIYNVINTTATDVCTFYSFQATDAVSSAPTPRYVGRALGATIIPDVVSQPLTYVARSLGGTLLYEARTFIPRALGGIYIPDTVQYVGRSLESTLSISGVTSNTYTFTDALTIADSLLTVATALPVDSLTTADTLLAVDGTIPIDSLTVSDIGNLQGWGVDGLSITESMLTVDTALPIEALSIVDSLRETDTITAGNSYFFGTLETIAAHASSEAADGVNIAMMTLGWDSYEPTEGTFSSSYITSKLADLATFQAAGQSVILSIGLHFTPSWVFGYTNSSYVNQFGNSFGQANLAFNQTLRTKAQVFIHQIHSDFNLNSFFSIRVTSGGGSECMYPAEDADGIHTNGYWAYDSNAQSGGNLPPTLSVCPYPGWHPGDATYGGNPFTTAQVQTWYTWYQGALLDEVNWLIQTCKSLGFVGYFQTITAGLGTRPDDYTTAINNNLNGTGDGNATMGRGAVWNKFYDGLIDKAKVVAYCSSLADGSGSPGDNLTQSTDSSVAITDTQIDNWSAARWITYCAGRNNLPIAGENPGSGGSYGVAMMQTAAQQMQASHMQGMMWAHDSNLYDGISGVTLSDYATILSMVNGSLFAIDSLLITERNNPTENLSLSESLLDGGAYIPLDALTGISTPLDWDIYQPTDDTLIASDSATWSQVIPGGLTTTTYSFLDALVASDGLLVVLADLSIDTANIADLLSSGGASSTLESLLVSDLLLTTDAESSVDALTVLDIASMVSVLALLLQYISMTWITRDMQATWMTRDKQATWKTRDEQAGWVTRDDLATWKTRS